MSSTELNEIIRADEYQLLAILFRWNIIKDEQICLYCQVNMKLKKSTSHIDKFEWSCLNYSCTHYQTSCSIRSESWISAFKASSTAILQAIYYYLFGENLVNIMHYSGLGKKPPIKLKKIIIEKIKTYFSIHPIKLRGPDIIVQIDETKLNYNVKNHRGRSIAPCWCFCIVDTSFSPALGYAQIVTDRSSDTLLPIINNVVKAGSIIHSDEWKAYIGLNNSDMYRHNTVCHKYRFVGPQTGVHTQHVESYNNRLKYKIKQMKGLSLVQREDFLFDFMFKERCGESRFQSYINLLKY